MYELFYSYIGTDMIANVEHFSIIIIQLNFIKKIYFKRNSNTV